MQYVVSSSAAPRGLSLAAEPPALARNAQTAFLIGQIRVARRDVHRVEPAPFSHPQVQGLLHGRHDGARASCLGANDAVALQSLWERGARLLVLRDRDERVLACGAVALDTGEIGGLFVAPDQRRSGLGERLLRGLEADAQRARCRRLWLRVGAQQDAALRLFARLDYRLCDEFSAPQRATLLMAKGL